MKTKLFFGLMLFIIIAVAQQPIDVLKTASFHNMENIAPGADFFNGDLLGNGGLGVVVCSRYDALLLHFGHNDVWDIRIEELPMDSIGTFNSVYSFLSGSEERLQKQGIKNPTPYDIYQDEEYKKYANKVAKGYRQSYPRPFPCGSLLLGFNSKKAVFKKRVLDISKGVWTGYYQVDGKQLAIEVFVDRKSDRVWIRTVNEKNEDASFPFNRMRFVPFYDKYDKLPKPVINEKKADNRIVFKQLLPQLKEDYKDYQYSRNDNAICGAVTFNAPYEIKIPEEINPANPIPFWADDDPYHFPSGMPSHISFELFYGKADKIMALQPDIKEGFYTADRKNTEEVYRNYWMKSAIETDDKELEGIWYRNTYFLSCSFNKKYQWPGLFGNFMFEKIGTSWHSDYHSNYNMQQPEWGMFSSNRIDLHEPYINMVEFLAPLSKKWAATYYGMPGASYPHSAYPVPMTVFPYPVPDWGWEICETPWTVQGLWWHYLYTKDDELLRSRIYPLLKDAALFIEAYLNNPYAKDKKRFNDGFIHVFPTVAPEVYGITLNFQYNADAIVDVALIQFLFKAVIESGQILNVDKDLQKRLAQLLKKLPPYYCVTKNNKTVWTDIRNGSAQLIYNVPSPMAPVFPGEQVSLNSSPEILKIANNTYDEMITEGGNDLVYNPLIEARLGRFDKEAFKQYVQYCMLPDGACFDRMTNAGGRYSDMRTDVDFMGSMGVWMENFALVAPINESLLQSVDGIIRVFPSWKYREKVRFDNLRAQGAFLVSAEFDQEMRYVKIFSEKGGMLKVFNSWEGKKMKIKLNNVPRPDLDGKIIEIFTVAGDVLEITNN